MRLVMVGVPSFAPTLMALLNAHATQGTTWLLTTWAAMVNTKV